jgi:tetratricopeptide (TPR) repeat protein
MSQPAPGDSLASRQSHLRIVILLAVLVVVAYASTFRYGFLYDDHEQIEKARYFTDAGWLPEYFKHPTALNYYRPLFMAWVLANRLLLGGSATAFHVTSVLVHLAATLLCYLVAFQLTRRIPLAAIAAVVFAVHPAHVESVAWISGVTDPLLAVFTLGSFAAYLRGREGRPALWWSLSAVLAFGAMLSKEVGVVVPLLIGAHALIFAEGNAGSRLRTAVAAALPSAIVATIYLGIRSHVLAGVAHNVSGSPAAMVLTWPKVLLFYVWHLIWPTRLSIYYDLHFISSAKEVVFPVLLLLVLAAALIRLARHGDRSLLSFGVLWILITLAPAFYLRAFNLNDIVHDRYLYLAVFGFGLILAELLLRLPDLGTSLAGMRTTSTLATFLVVMLLLGSTVAEQLYYADDLRLFYRAVQVSPNSDGAWVNFGIQLARAQRRDEAYIAYQRAIQANDGNWLAHADLAFLLMESGQLSAAEPELERALAINPRYAAGLQQLAFVRANQGRNDEASRLNARAIEIEPMNAEFHYLRAYILSQLGDTAGERRELEATLRLDPNHQGARARYNARFASQK